MDPKAKPPTPTDFYPGKTRPRDSRPQTLEEKIGMIEAAMGCGPISGRSRN